MQFQLFWLRETNCDAGTPLDADALPPAIRERVLALTTPECDVYQLRLPFLDRREEHRQEEILAALPVERVGTLIRAVIDPATATRDMAATCALADPLWADTPKERDPEYFATWQRVSLALQRWLRERIAAEFLRDPASLEDRAGCYPILVYQACRPFCGKPRSEFTYDLRDFPWCEETLAASWKLCGRGLQRIMGSIEQRLRELGNESLARKYSPVWHEDVLVGVKRKPKVYADLLARESAIINALIDLGTQRDIEHVNRAARIINQQLRKITGPGGSRDLRFLGCEVFEEATRNLAKQPASEGQDVFDAWPQEHVGMSAAGSPDARVRV